MKHDLIHVHFNRHPENYLFICYYESLVIGHHVDTCTKRGEKIALKTTAGLSFNTLIHIKYDTSRPQNIIVNVWFDVATY